MCVGKQSSEVSASNHGLSALQVRLLTEESGTHKIRNHTVRRDSSGGSREEVWADITVAESMCLCLPLCDMPTLRSLFHGQHAYRFSHIQPLPRLSSYAYALHAPCCTCMLCMPLISKNLCSLLLQNFVIRHRPAGYDTESSSSPADRHIFFQVSPFPRYCGGTHFDFYMQADSVATKDLIMLAFRTFFGLGNGSVFSYIYRSFCGLRATNILAWGFHKHTFTFF